MTNFLLNSVHQSERKMKKENCDQKPYNDFVFSMCFCSFLSESFCYFKVVKNTNTDNQDFKSKIDAQNFTVNIMQILVLFLADLRLKVTKSLQESCQLEKIEF